MVSATLRFYGELNDFLPRERRGREIATPCTWRRVYWKGSHYERMRGLPGDVAAGVEPAAAAAAPDVELA